MCGLSGIINLDQSPVDAVILKQMNDALRHRGPNNDGYYLENNIGLAHRRLSIIDIFNGTQPMRNEDKSVYIVFNGEIYNHHSIRNTLKSKGHIFLSECDTEAIVHAYEEYGYDCISHLEGMFAFAIYDSKAQIVFLARDRMGEKPLFYYKTEKNFIFASELQSLTTNPSFKKEINLHAILHYLSIQYIPENKTIYQNVFKVNPAEIVIFDLKTHSLTKNKYWKVNFQKKEKNNYKDAQLKLRYLLNDSVKRRLMSDVPLGTFLSGGIDSTIVTGIISKLLNREINTFTIGFDSAKYDERKFANIAALSYGSIHHEKIVVPTDFSILEKLARHYGEPYADSSMIPTFLLSQFASQEITVAISGDGADELFAGYYRYLLYRYSTLFDYIPAKLKNSLILQITKILPKMKNERSKCGNLQRILLMLTKNKEERYLSIINRCSSNIKNELIGERLKNQNILSTEEFFKSEMSLLSSSNKIEKLMELDIGNYLPGDILTKVDIASMANSLELRTPFMDYNVVEFAASLPLSYKQTHHRRKKILIDTYKDILPTEIMNRKKSGFSLPLGDWFRNEWKNKTFELFSNLAVSESGLINQKKANSLFKEHLALNADHSQLLFSITMLELWHREFISKK